MTKCVGRSGVFTGVRTEFSGTLTIVFPLFRCQAPQNGVEKTGK